MRIPYFTRALLAWLATHAFVLLLDIPADNASLCMYTMRVLLLGIPAVMLSVVERARSCGESARFWGYVED